MKNPSWGDTWIQRDRGKGSWGRFKEKILGTVFTIFLTAIPFFVLPLIQSISSHGKVDTVLRRVDTAVLPSPEMEEPKKEEPPKEEPEEKVEPPSPHDEAPLMDLSGLELTLNPGGGGAGWLKGAMGKNLDLLASSKAKKGQVFSLADLDRRPRAIVKESPYITPRMRKKMPGRVILLFVVDERGRVLHPIIQKSTNPVFNRSALEAIKKWRFEPGKRQGKKVRIRLRLPMVFKG